MGHRSNLEQAPLRMRFRMACSQLYAGSALQLLEQRVMLEILKSRLAAEVEEQEHELAPLD